MSAKLVIAYQPVQLTQATLAPTISDAILVVIVTLAFTTLSAGLKIYAMMSLVSVSYGVPSILKQAARKAKAVTLPLDTADPALLMNLADPTTFATPVCARHSAHSIPQAVSMD